MGVVGGEEAELITEPLITVCRKGGGGKGGGGGGRREEKSTAVGGSI